jgi:hypothetical protein
MPRKHQRARAKAGIGLGTARACIVNDNSKQPSCCHLTGWTVYNTPDPFSEVETVKKVDQYRVNPRGRF